MGRLLNKIKEPNDIKRISPKLYPILAQEIRDFLIDHVSQTGLPRIWEQWKLQWLCISVFIFQKIRWYTMWGINPMFISY